MCRWFVRVFAALYVMALGLLAIGTWGLFGQERDPLSGVFVVLLGLPWHRFIGGMPDGILPWLAAVAPLLNLVILAFICRFFTRFSPVGKSHSRRNK